MTEQMTDRELIQRLSSAAYLTGALYERWANGRGADRAPIDQDAIHKRIDLENQAVDRLIRRDEKIKLLQATIKDLKRQLTELGAQ